MYARIFFREPEVQEKVRQEIWEIVGQDNVPSLEDRVNLPFTDATILEIQRMADIGKTRTSIFYFSWVRYCYNI